MKGSDVCNPPLVVFLVIFIILGSFGLLDSTRGDWSKSVKFCRFRVSYKVLKSYIRKYKDVGYPSEVGEGTNPNLRRGWVAWVIFWAEEGLNKVKRGGDSCVMNVVASLRWRKASSEQDSWSLLISSGKHFWKIGRWIDMSRNQRPFGGPDQRIYFSSSKKLESKGNGRVTQLPAQHSLTQSGIATVMLFYCDTLKCNFSTSPSPML